MAQFYEGTKKRISVSNGAETVEEFSKSSIKNPGKTYTDFRNEVLNLCNEVLSNKLTDDERGKVLWLKSRVDIEL